MMRFGAQNIIFASRNPCFSAQYQLHLGERFILVEQEVSILTVTRSWTVTSDRGDLLLDLCLVESILQLPGGQEYGSVGALGHRLGDVSVDSVLWKRLFVSSLGCGVSVHFLLHYPKTVWTWDTARATPYSNWWHTFAHCARSNSGPAKQHVA